MYTQFGIEMSSSTIFKCSSLSKSSCKIGHIRCRGSAESMPMLSFNPIDLSVAVRHPVPAKISKQNNSSKGLSNRADKFLRSWPDDRGLSSETGSD